MLRNLPASCSTRCAPAVGQRHARSPRIRGAPRCQAGGRDPGKPQTSLGLKAVWFGAEGLGNVLGLLKGDSQRQERGEQQGGAAPARLDRAAALAEIRADYDATYFVSGEGDMAAYADDCLFADPFAGFRGTARFKRNVRNLGGLLDGITLELLEWREEQGQLFTRWRFSGVLRLPWRPLLAAAGSTTHVFDESTGRVVQHIEAWDVQPGRVVRSLLKPSRVPTNRWEVLAGALYEGDPKSIWFALSAPLLALAACAGALDAGAHLLGGGLSGPAELLLAALLLSCAITEVVKFASAMYGGDTGSGGRF